jgi:hypothetical protein
MDHAARRRLIYLLLRNGEIGGQPQGDDHGAVVAAGDRRDVRRLDADAPVDDDRRLPPAEDVAPAA